MHVEVPHDLSLSEIQYTSMMRHSTLLIFSRSLENLAFLEQTTGSPTTIKALWHSFLEVSGTVDVGGREPDLFVQASVIEK